MYPHIIIAFNIERHTMIGKIIIVDINEDAYDHVFVDDEIIDVSTDEDSDSEEEKEFNIGYDSGKDFLDNYLTGDILSIGHKWFNLPNTTTIHDRFKKRFNIKPKKRFTIKNIVKYFLDEVIISSED